eukprot:jgi/Orpsp1_1/1180175/evm.model.c7180000072391.1
MMIKNLKNFIHFYIIFFELIFNTAKCCEYTVINSILVDQTKFDRNFERESRPSLNSNKLNKSKLSLNSNKLNKSKLSLNSNKLNKSKLSLGNNREYLEETKDRRIGDETFPTVNYKGGELEEEWQWVKNISIVYTWVDGSDINFQDLKSKYNGGKRNVNSRDRSADELQYSLRSLEKYLPWHQGMIYIVTCQQVPKWLDTHHPRVKMVFHKDIFPKQVYPTFDSGTIELYFDKIPGISEKFIYFNDDFFINNYIHPSLFFTRDGFYPKFYKNGNLFHLSRYNHKQNLLKKVNMFQSMCYVTHELIKKYFDKNYKYYFLHHSAYVFYRDLMEPFREYFHEELKIQCSNKFRTWYKPHSLYLYLSFVEYIAKHGDFPKKSMENGNMDPTNGYKLPENKTIGNYSCKIIPNSINSEFFSFNVVTNDSEDNENSFNDINSHPKLLIFNFNDDYSETKSLLEFTEFMMTKYPEPSFFEKREYVEMEKYYYSKLNPFSYSERVNSRKMNNTIYSGIVDTIKQQNLEIIKEYLSKKALLSGPLKEISRREEEEINFLMNYQGENLSNEWKWAERISLVYILENFEEKTIEYEGNKLKYSLYSIEKYLPWHKGNIFIITQQKIQKELSWLNPNNEKIKVINQDIILPENNLNFISKPIIEMYLDQIPGLSERFIYLNNNHFFINYTHPRFFFSKEFYPKYNLEQSLSEDEISSRKNTDKSFFHTYKIVMNYFGRTYVNNYRFFKNAPYSFYRDLFGPTRQIYKKYINKLLKFSEDTSILPLYLVSTYNIYGTAQPYYPEFTLGYGKIKNIKLPLLNPNRTLDFYGFDITSPSISNSTMIIDINLNSNSCKNMTHYKQN